MREDELLNAFTRAAAPGLVTQTRGGFARRRRISHAAALRRMRATTGFFLQTVTDRGRALCHPQASCLAEGIFGELFALWFFNQLVKIQ